MALKKWLHAAPYFGNWNLTTEYSLVSYSDNPLIKNYVLRIVFKFILERNEHFLFKLLKAEFSLGEDLSYIKFKVNFWVKNNIRIIIYWQCA